MQRNHRLVPSRSSINTIARRGLITAVTASLALAALATAAHATPAIATGLEPEPSYESRTEVDLGMLIGGSDIADDQRQTLGLHLNLGRRFGDLALLAEYDYLSVGKASSANQGTLNRAGLVARYSLLRTQNKPGNRPGPLSGDYWVEAGAGMQRLSWDAGGTLTRPDIALGFGWQFNGVIGRKSPKPRYFGPYVAFRTHISRSPDTGSDTMTTCGGPCNRQTAPPRNDVSMFLHVGINWGR